MGCADVSGMVGGSVRIVVLGNYAKSLVLFRGPLLSAFSKAGHEVIACAPEHDAATEAALQYIGVRYCVMPVERAGINPVKDLIFLIRLVWWFRVLQPDVILAYTIKPVIYGSLAAHLAGVRVTYSIITGLGYAFSGGTIKRRIVNGLVTRLYRAALKTNSTVFFQNPDDLMLFVSLHIVKERNATLINGSCVDIRYYAQAPVDTRPIFLMITRLLRDKGVVEYAEAAREVKSSHPHAVFRLLGPLDSNPSAISRSEVGAWQQEGMIDYLGTADDVRPFLRNASVYVLPSYREGTPRSVLEAMAMGRPIVTTDAPGCRETVVDGENGFLVPVKDAKALAAAMERFITDPQLIDRMGKRSREIAEEKYDVENVNAVIMKAMGLA